MSKIKLILISLIIISSFFIYKINAQETSDTILQEDNIDTQQVPQEQTKQDNLTGIITGIKEENSQEVYGQIQYYQILNVKITSKIKQNEQVEIYSAYDGEDSPYKYKVGDKVTVLRIYTDSGMEQYYVTDYLRTNIIITFAVTFVAVVLILGRLSGLLSIIGLAYTLAILLTITVPRLADNGNSIVVTLISTFLIAPVIFYITQGLKKKTTLALAGTLISVLITVILTLLFAQYAKLTGAASKEALFLQYTMGGLYNAKGLLLGGIALGSLGVLSSITISQVGIVETLYQNNKKSNIKTIFIEAIKLSKNNLVNILNLVFLLFLSMSFPILVLFTKSGIPISILINSEIISEDILRISATGIGFMLSLPITTLLSAKFLMPSDDTVARKKILKSK